MNARFPVLLTSLLVVALAAPGAMAKNEYKGKDKWRDGKEKKDKKEKKNKKDENDWDDRDGNWHDRDGDWSDHDGDWRDHDHDGNGRVTICHIPPGNPGARHTITISESAWDAHRRHGDRRGSCDRHGDHDGDHGDHDGDHGDHSGRDGFDRLDRNHDGRLSAAEWPYGNDSFRRLDRNHDGVLRRDEYARHDSEPEGRRFKDLDRDHDGRLGRSEWPFGRDSFNRTDRNGDRRISREEYGRH